VDEPATTGRDAMPPEELRWRATGERDAEAFLRSAAADVDFLDQALGSERKSLKDFSSILDFGCGCGRLIGALRRAGDQWATVRGTDIDAAAIAWCKDNIGGASFAVNGAFPPLPHEAESIDLAIAHSVFSHLDAAHQSRWLGELQRIMKPGCYLLISFRHADAVERFADSAERERVSAELGRDGIGFMTSEQWKGAFPDWYGEAFQTREYVRKHWGSYFEVCHITPAGPNGQEVAVLRARESTFMQRLFRRP
jgi:SAM-dependent methyltransferase